MKKTSKRQENLNDFAQKTTDKIIAILETGNIDSNDWSKGWIGFKGCYNFDTGTVYKGINQFNLSMNHFDSPLYSTFLGWKKIGCSVKGSKGIQILKMSMYKKLDKNTNEEKTVFYSDIDYVFNSEQVTDGKENIPEIKVHKNPEKSIEELEHFAENCKIKTNFVNGNKAFYSPISDAVTMPFFEQFKSNDAYYATLFHEYAHATGNIKRLNRNQSGSFGSSEYAFEELIAELSSVFTMQSLGYYDTEIRKDHLQYIKGWLKALKSDSQFIIKASKLAMKSTDWLLKKQPENKQKTQVA